MNNKKLIAFSCLFFGLVHCKKSGDSTAVTAAPTPAQGSNWSMVVLGDSIAAGALADTTMGELISGETAEKFGQVTQAIAENQSLSPQVIDDVFSDPDLTAFSGTQEWSHPERLRRLRPDITLSVSNIAVSGAKIKSSDNSILKQLGTLETKYAEGQPPANYVIINAGGNDFCAGTSAADFESAYTETLAKAKALHPQSVILLVSIVDVPKVLSSEFSNLEAFSEEPAPGQTVSFTCGEVRAVTNFCGATNSAENVARKDEMNAAIRRVATAGQQGYPGKIVVADAVADPGLVVETNLAADCFHPSEAGHKALSDASWPAVEPALRP